MGWDETGCPGGRNGRCEEEQVAGGCGVALETEDQVYVGDGDGAMYVVCGVAWGSVMWQASPGRERLEARF